MTPDEKLFDEIISQTLEMLRLGAGQSVETLKRLDALAKELAANFPVEDLTEVSAAQVKKILADSQKIIADNYDKIVEAEAEAAQAVAKSIAGRTTEALNLALGTAAAKAPRAAYFASLASNVLIEGNPAAAWWQGQSLATQRAFTGALRQGLLNNETNGQLISRIFGKNGEPGVMNVSRLHATTLVQTSVMAVANDARRATFDANADVIKGIRQVSTLDGHTSPTCVAYSGASWDMKREPLNGSPPFNGGCPRHFKCRSVEVPITKTFRELGLDIDEAPPSTRASSDGQIPAGTTFDDFLRRKGPAYQNEVLGPGKAELWRDGKITLRDLVSGTGNPLTLGDLTAKVNADQIFSPAVFAKTADDASVTASKIIESFPGNTTKLIKKTERELSELVETKKAHGKGDSYTRARLELHRKILYEGVYGFDPDNPDVPKFYPGLLDEKAVRKALPKKGEAPTFTMLGGRGGSGKSAFDGEKFASAKVYDKDKVLLFDADHIKHMLPEYRGFNAFQVHEESSDLLKLALHNARQSGANVVLDGTLKSYDSARKLLDSFVLNGYRFEAHYMHLPRQEAAKRAVGRYLTSKGDGSGRYVPVDIVLGNRENELNFMRLFEFSDAWSFRDNNVARGEAPRLIAERKRKNG